jgi:L,D-transpeptidase catalytic domain
VVRAAAWILVAAAAAVPAGAGDARAREVLAAAVPALDGAVLRLALRASSCADRRGLLLDADTLTVIDYSRPSTEPRLFVLDLAQRTLLHQALVAHGRGSGENFATSFSNQPGSLQSSLGLFVTLATYTGRHGPSLRLLGLEPGVNDHAEARAIVMHGASYVSEAFAALHGRIGRSLGCPALPLDIAPRVIDAIRGGSALFAYYPDPAWLGGSPFLGACSAGQPEASPAAEAVTSRARPSTAAITSATRAQSN